MTCSSGGSTTEMSTTGRSSSTASSTWRIEVAAVPSAPEIAARYPVAPVKSEIWSLAIPRNGRNRAGGIRALRGLGGADASLRAALNGNGPVRLRVPRRCNRVLKNVILGAAKSAAAASKESVFADSYQRWLDAHRSPRVARRNLARSLATVMWGMWKSGSVFDPRMTGRVPAEIA